MVPVTVSAAWQLSVRTAHKNGVGTVFVTAMGVNPQLFA
jgi:hypothetical protein